MFEEVPAELVTVTVRARQPLMNKAATVNKLTIRLIRFIAFAPVTGMLLFSDDLYLPCDVP
ncbi:MAG: hypothetical protein CMJ64_12300 [Planctomycetaceae bacterium]|nr:hypothetical protein [Planctomycetaceae bacterium]